MYLAQAGESGDEGIRSNRNASSFVVDVSDTVVNGLVANKTSSSETHHVPTYSIANTVMMPVLKQNESIKSMNLKTQQNRHALVGFFSSQVFQLASLSLNSIVTLHSFFLTHLATF